LKLHHRHVLIQCFSNCMLLWREFVVLEWPSVQADWTDLYRLLWRRGFNSHQRPISQLFYLTLGHRRSRRYIKNQKFQKWIIFHEFRVSKQFGGVTKKIRFKVPRSLNHKLIYNKTRTSNDKASLKWPQKCAISIKKSLLLIHIANAFSQIKQKDLKFIECIKKILLCFCYTDLHSFGMKMKEFTEIRKENSKVENVQNV